ncbi:alkaline serine protease [Paludifilum halophilum]|uniref:Alkaline serine protease n=2 Tax=Paludifilum halophilum TaxID=1642702 RepID=A0A235B8L1_9BACL|nr:alkaline serine protease [Paludifilum halophilum]
MLSLALLLSFALSLPMSATAAVDQPNVDQSAEAKYVSDELIVKFKPGTAKNTKASVHSQKDTKVIDQNKKIGFEVVELKNKSVKEAKKAYEKNPNVEYAEPNYIVHADWVPNDPSYSRQYALPQVDAPQAWDVTRGSSNVKIAIVDTGVQYNHPDLQGKVERGYDFVDRDWDPNDGNGHGTHCAGIAAAATNNGTGIAGMAPNNTIYAVRVLNNNGSGTWSDVANGITHAADNADVVSLSLGGTRGSSTLQNAVNYAWSNNTVVVAAAGNAGTSTPHYPAYYSNAIAVAATDSNDNKASFSTYGSWVDVAAPGVSIYSTYPTNSYQNLSGTSMATPYVAGLAGLLKSQGRSASNVRAAIENTADNISGTGYYWTHGRINANDAVRY